MKAFRLLVAALCLGMIAIGSTVPGTAAKYGANGPSADVDINLLGDANFAEASATGTWRGPEADAVQNLRYRVCDEATDALKVKTKLMLALKNKQKGTVEYAALWNQIRQVGPAADCALWVSEGFSSVDYDYIAMKIEYAYVPPDVDPWNFSLSSEAWTIYQTPWDYNPYYCPSCLTKPR